MRGNEELNRLLITNREEGWRQVVEKYSAPLYRYAYKFVQSDAEDVVQEVFILAYPALLGYSVERIMALSLGAWLYRITKNHCLRWLKQRKRTVAQVPLDSLTIREQNESLEQAQRRKEAEDIIGALPPLYREVFFLRFMKDLKIADIARQLGKQEGTIRSIISRGRDLLRRQWKDCPEKDD